MRSIFINNVDDDNVINKIDTYDCVSFDVFDTLVKRNLKTPSDMFEIMGLQLEKEFGIKDFACIRIDAEKLSCRKNPYCTLEDIYDVVMLKLPNVEKSYVMKLEEKYELSYCQANIRMMEIYKYARLKNKRIIAVSDMYLSRKIIEKILLHCGYVMDEIYVSCEEKACKKKGQLFKKVLKKENIFSQNIVHIGDSFRADFLGAKKNGIASIKIEKKVRLYNSVKYKNDIDEKLKYGIHESIINNNLQLNKSYYEKFGFSVLGPSLFSFCKWIERQCMRNEIENVFFFARDGFIIKQAFDKIKCDRIKSHYLCVSRRSLRVPYNASHSSLDEVISFFPTTKKIDIETLVGYLGLSIDSAEEILNKFGLHRRDIVYYREINTKYRKLLEQLMPLYLDKAQEELKNAVFYLRQEKVKGKIAVVDIGWHNSMQFCLENILNGEGIENDITGLYFGIQSKESLVKHSYGFIREPNGDDSINSTGAYIGLIESFFLEQQGTTIRYFFNSQKYIPERENYEYELNSKEYTAYQDIHNGALKYVEIIRNLINYDSLALNGHDAYLPIYSFGICPYISDVDRFDNFRYFSEGTYFLVGYKGIIHYLFNPDQLKNDLYNARWKIGFLKKLIKINLPYYKIYVKLKGMQK